MGSRFQGGIAPGRHAVEEPLYRQSGADRHPQPVLPLGDQRRPLRPARDQPRRLSRASGCPASGMEFASEMVIKASAAEAAHRRSAGHLVARPARPRAASAPVARRLAASALPADAEPDLGCSAVPAAAAMGTGAGDPAGRHRSISSARCPAPVRSARAGRSSPASCSPAAISAHHGPRHASSRRSGGLSDPAAVAAPLRAVAQSRGHARASGWC